MLYLSLFFFFNDTATTEIYTLSLHDALPIAGPAPTDLAPFTRFYSSQYQVAEHVSPPLSEEIKVTLKVSQNLHAGMGPYLLGALVGKDTKNPLDAGFHVEHEFLESAKLDLSGTGQGDGAGGDWADLRSEEHTSELQSRLHLVCRLLLEKNTHTSTTRPIANPATRCPWDDTTVP